MPTGETMDPIADMLTIIRNAQAVRKETVKVSFSNTKFLLAQLLEREGFIAKADKKGESKRPVIILTLKYDEAGSPKIHALKRVSKPGQRIYVGYKDIRQIKSGYGRAIVSTPKGLVTGEEARKLKVGGEYMFEIW